MSVIGLLGLGLGGFTHIVLPTKRQRSVFRLRTNLRSPGSVQNAATYRLSDLQAEPAATEAVYFNTGAVPVSATFTGVLL